MSSSNRFFVFVSPIRTLRVGRPSASRRFSGASRPCRRDARCLVTSTPAARGSREYFRHGKFRNKKECRKILSLSRRGGLGFADSRLRTRPFLVRRGLCGDHLQEATAPESVPIDPSSAPLPSIHGDVPTLPYFGSLLNDLESPGGLYAAPSAPTRSIS